MWTNRRIPLFIALLFVVFLLVSCSGAASRWKDGQWQGTAPGIHGDVQLTVSVEKGKIAKITIDKEEEAEGVTDLAFTRIPESIIRQQTTKVDAVSGATGSSKAIMAAVEDALTKAVKQ